jgi:excisionase family DNA binding protein
LRINGKFEGKLNTKGNLMVGQNAHVIAEICGEIITIAGKVKGNIKATRELKLISPAYIAGNIETPVLSVAEGAVIDGNIRMSGMGSAESMKQFLSVDEVAQYLEIDKGLVSEWADNGKLPGVKDGNSWRFERTVLDKWVSNEKIN